MRLRQSGKAGARLPSGGEAYQHQLPKQQGATLALPVLGRLLGNSANLFQVGVLLGTIPTLLAGVVCCYWAYQVCMCVFVLWPTYIVLHAAVCRALSSLQRKHNINADANAIANLGANVECLDSRATPHDKPRQTGRTNPSQYDSTVGART